MGVLTYIAKLKKPELIEISKKLGVHYDPKERTESLRLKIRKVKSELAELIQSTDNYNIGPVHLLIETTPAGEGIQKLPFQFNVVPPSDEVAGDGSQEQEFSTDTSEESEESEYVTPRGEKNSNKNKDKKELNFDYQSLSQSKRKIDPKIRSLQETLILETDFNLTRTSNAKTFDYFNRNMNLNTPTLITISFITCKFL